MKKYNRKGWLLKGVPAYQGNNTLATKLYNCGTYLTEYGRKHASMNLMQSIRSTTKEELASYAADMEANGYAIESHSSIENNQFYRFVKAKQRVYVNYFGNEGRATVELDESGRPSLAEISYISEPSEGKQAEYYMYRLKMDPYGYSLKQEENVSGYVDNGACLIVRCADNSIIVIDGGSSLQMEAEDREHFWKFLCEITDTKKDGVVTIAAWCITHFDSDHSCGYSVVLKENPERYHLERFIGNLPDLKVTKKANDTAAVKAGSAIRNHYPDCQDVKLRTGDVLRIADITINVVYTHEDFADEAGQFNTANFNNTSTVMMFTSSSGMKMLITGDMMSKAENVLCRNFSAKTLKCDIFQQPHHNRTDISTVYEYANAQVMFFTQTVGTLTENPTDEAHAALAKKWCSEWYCGGTETVGFGWENDKANLIYHKEERN